MINMLEFILVSTDNWFQKILIFYVRYSFIILFCFRIGDVVFDDIDKINLVYKRFAGQKRLKKNPN